MASRAKTPSKPKVKATEAQVKNYLQENPDFFTKNERILNSLNLPTLTGGNVTSMNDFQLTKLKQQVEKLEVQNKTLVHTATENLNIQQHIQALTMKLVRVESIEELESRMEEMKEELEIESMVLFVNDGKRTAYSMDCDDIDDFFDDDEIVKLRTLYDDEDKVIHGRLGDKIASDALLRLVNQDGYSIGLLAMGSREQSRFHAGQGVDVIEFLASMFAYVVEKTVTSPVPETAPSPQLEAVATPSTPAKKAAPKKRAAKKPAKKTAAKTTKKKASSHAAGK